MRITLALAVASFAAAQPSSDFFESKIRPVLAEKCYACHSAKVKNPMGGLRLDEPLPDDRTRKRVLLAVSYTDPALRMPPTGKLSDDSIADLRRWIEMGAPDPRQASATAANRGSIDYRKGREFWAFQQPKAVEPPSGNGNPIDRFLEAKRREKGIKAAPPADKAAWLRRVRYDLTGLPPSAAEIAEFLADTSPNAYRTVIDRLLDSPSYGERQARHWLDLVRFAETNGHEFDNDKLDSWRYRDYVIRAFQQDVPYDQFIREHIAGDLIAKPRRSADGSILESPLGTGVYWFGEVLNSATDSVKSRADRVDNQIDVFGKAFLGLTLACARCHDHKFDPIATEDYYALAGVMHSTYVREAVIDSPERAAAIARAKRDVASLRAKLAPTPAAAPVKSKLRDGDILFEDFDKPSYEGWATSGHAFGSAPQAGIADSFGAATERLAGSLTSKKFTMPKLWVHIRMAGTPTDTRLRDNTPLRVTVVADDYKSIYFTVKQGKQGFHWVTQRMTKEIGRACYFEIVDRSRDGHIAVDRIVLSDHDTPPADEPGATAPTPATAAIVSADETAALQARITELETRFPESSWGMLSQDEDPHDVRLHLRGSHQNLGDPVPRHFLRIMAGDNPETFRNGSGRLEVADWIASARNPLTARVMVNRIWKQHFGQGLVRTADNFGKTGERPTHPELLDWLALEFIKSGWSVKAMHRAMLLSDAYRMASTEDPKTAQADPRNELLHHMPVRRLEAEAIRDAILAVSGSLRMIPYGPSVKPHISKYQDGRGKPESGPLDGDGRRSIYLQVRRNFITPMFLAFDYPPPISTIGSRGSSTVPSQALLMLNNEFIAGEARRWAERMIAESTDPAQRIERMYLDAFGRAPETWERKETLAFVDRKQDAAEAWTNLAHVLINTAEFIYVR
ncbi:MAG: DUF1553 domain-containing protein [Bryobacteraceae bacterium]